jgi:hypothetical protein
MVTTLILWVYQLFIILPFGFFLLSLNKSYKKKASDISYFTLAFLGGIVFLTTLSSFFTFFINISWQVHSFVLMVSILLWLYLIRSKSIPNFQVNIWPKNIFQRISLVTLLIAVVITLLSATTIPENPDTAIYHAQGIHWIENFKVVPGLGNLHERFAYNSSWLVINALFSLSFLNIQSFHILPSLLFLVCASYFFSGVFAVSGGSKRISDLIKYVFFIATLLLLQTEISSPGTDFPVTLIIWIICAEWVKLLESAQELRTFEGIVLAIIAFFCATIKLSSVPIVLFILWVLITEIRKKRLINILVICIAALMIFVPYIGRNIILSGHLFFPGLKNDPIHVDWGIPSADVEVEKSTIHWFALLPRVDLKVFNTMTWQDQYKEWFYNQIPRHKAMLTYLVLIPIPFSLLLLFRKWRTLLKSQSEICWPILCMYAGVLFWLITAPTFRFGYGFIMAAIGLTCAFLVHFIMGMNTLLNKGALFLAFILTLLVGFEAGKGSLHVDTIRERILLPQDYPTWHTESCDFGNFTILCQTEWDSCWYYPFPCANAGNMDIEMRGSDFSEGFRVIP